MLGELAHKVWCSMGCQYCRGLDIEAESIDETQDIQ